MHSHVVVAMYRRFRQVRGKHRTALAMVALRGHLNSTILTDADIAHLKRLVAVKVFHRCTHFFVG